MSKRDILCELGLEDAVVFENPDYDKMVKCLMKEDGIDEVEAMEFIDYNTLRSLPYVENAPIVIFKI